MKYFVSVMFDAAAGVFSRPMLNVSRGVAVRVFQDETRRKDVQNDLFSHPEDFTLMELGWYDDEFARFEVHEPLAICKAVDFKE